MRREELIAHTKRLMETIPGNAIDVSGKLPEVLEFLRVYGGPRNSFFMTLETGRLRGVSDQGGYLRSLLKSFLDYVESGLHEEISPERRAQLDVVSDFLEMANSLLETKDVHPAAPAMLIGATLEEFLRTWVEVEGLSLNGRKPGIEAYSQVLRDANLLTKQDGKDITAWAGVRNHAAHGEWSEIADKNRVRLMLEGVNLFMRKYGEREHK